MIDIGTYTLADWAWRATLVLLAAGLLNTVLRTSSAAVRHLVWVCALAGVVAMPLVSRVLPQWKAPVAANLLEGPQTALLRAEARVAPATVPDSRSAHPGSSAPAAPARSRTLPLAAVWFAGAAAVLLHAALGWFFVMRLRRSAAPARPEASSMGHELAAQMGIGQAVEVLETRHASIPITFGIFRPAIVVPSTVADDPVQLRVVLMHELAHIARRDYLMHVVGQLACALYWFHPLAWLAQRQSLRLREQAADDLVLRHGVRASEYAGHLVGLARSLAAPRLCGSLAMAHRSNLEGRVRAILDGTVSRAALSRAAVVAAVLCAAVFVTGAASVATVTATQAAQPGAAAAGVREREQNILSVLERVKAVHGAQSLEYARAAAALGGFYYMSDRLPESVATYTPVIPIIERQLGKQSDELLQPLYVLGLAAQVKKDNTLAAEYYGRAVEIASANRLGTHPAIMARVALAQLLANGGDYTRAAALLQEGRAASSENSPAMAVLLETSARILRNLGSDADAEKATAAAKAMREVVVSSSVSTGSRPQDIYRVGGGVLPPKVLDKVEPEYSQEARALKVQGAVVLNTVVGADGAAHDVRVVRGVGIGLDQKAVEAVGQWRFQPGTKDGVPVNVQATIEVNFRLM